MLRLLPLLALALLLPLTGCNSTDYVVRTIEGDRVVFTDHPFFQLLPLFVGLSLVALGLPLITGRWKPKGKPRVAGGVLLVIGLAMLAAAMLVTPYTYAAVDRHRLEVRGGLLGQGTAATINLDEVKEIEITQVSRRGSRRTSRGRRKAIEVKFIPHEGKPQSLLMTSGVRRPALEYLVEKAPEWGLDVTDQRDEE